jgi:hypothetical protein
MTFLKHPFSAIATLISTQSATLSRLIIPLSLALTIFAAAGFAGPANVSAHPAATCGVQTLGSTNIVDDGSGTPGAVLGTLTVTVNTCTNQAFGQVKCFVADPFVQILLQNKTTSSWSNSTSCTAGQTITSAAVSVSYDAHATLSLAYIGDSYLGFFPSGYGYIFV